MSDPSRFPETNRRPAGNTRDPKPTGSLAEEIGKWQEFESLRQEVFLNLVRTHDQLTRAFQKVLKSYGLSIPKYNVLRILQGEGRPMPVRQIATRMVSPQTDISRLVDRLENDGWLRRQRSDSDRRVVLVQLAPRSLERLAELRPQIAAIHQQQMPDLTDWELQQLNQLLFRARIAST